VQPRLARQPMGRKRVLPTEGEDDEAKARSVRPTPAPLEEAPGSAGDERGGGGEAATKQLRRGAEDPLAGVGPQRRRREGGGFRVFPLSKSLPYPGPISVRHPTRGVGGCPLG
jgi:hypothetical protein